jgi:hypothetical protein
MTTTFRTAERADQGDGRSDQPRLGMRPASPVAEGADGNRRRAGWLATHPAWPLTALLAGYPIWWALGLGDYVWFLLAVPMLIRMAAWRIHRDRPLRVPPGFAIWLTFLIWATVAACTLTLTAPGTVPSPVSHRLVAWAIRTVSYFGITVLFLYAGNLTERELPRRKLVWLLGLIAIYTTVLGVAAIAAPHLQFTSPTALILPHSLQSNTFIQATTHPGLAQVQNVFGTASAQGRPKAPFDYTNTWGDCLTITVPWLLVVCLGSGAGLRRRLIGWATLLFALLGLLYSLNRGAWIAAGFAVVYLAVRLAARGRTGVMGGLVALLGIAVIVGLATPVHTIISLRLQNGKSNSIRTSLFALSMHDGLASPVLGFGDTRQQRGSPQSIAIGPSPTCEACGQNEVGSTGQLSLLIVSTGFVGAFLYYAFFAYGAWRYRRDRSAYGQVGVLVILLSFIYMFTYDAVAAPLGLTMLAYAVLWRNDMCRQLTLQNPRTAISRVRADWPDAR